MQAQAPFRLLPLIVAMAITPLALAEETNQPESDDTDTLDEVVVFGETYRNTATKTVLDPQDTPQGITVLDREALEMRDADSVASALRYASGVNTELRGGSVNRLELYNIRGFENLYNYYDGLPLIYIDGWNYQAQVDLAAVGQIEVFKGPTSTLYGAMPPGGMVNMIGKQPSTDSEHQVELATGSRNLLEGKVESQGQIGDSALSYSFVGLARGQDGQAETSRLERMLVAPSMDWQVSDDTLINLNFYYQNDPEMGIYSTLPAKGVILDNPNGDLPVDAYAGDVNWEKYERETTMAGFKINHDFNNNWTFLHNFRFTDGTGYQENTYSTGLAADDRTLSRQAYSTDEETQAITLDNQFTGLVQTGAVDHNLLFGLDLISADASIIYDDAVAPTIDLYDPDHDQIDPDALTFTRYTDQNLSKRQLGIYIQDQLEWGDLIVIGGLRYDDFESEIENNLNDTTTTQHETNFSKRIGALYNFNGVSPFISYADSFQPEAGTDTDGNKFEPSTGEQWEAGVKYESADRRTMANVSFYRIDKKNVPAADPDGGAYDKIQVGEVRSQGIEIDASVQPLQSLLVSLNYTYQNVEITEDETDLEGKTPVWVPEQLLSVWADYGFYNGALDGLTVGMGLRYIGESQLNEQNTDTVPSTTLMDMSLGYDLGSLNERLNGAELGLSVNNLLDERYATCFDDDNCWFGAERTVEASVSYTY
ncbi:ligand-gated channel protein [Saccharospirillum sp. MSK14-1]|uniref:TonB-dependent siderophore receptor n=1 Tax=Saccharospirillum sp. MSK14-1 TaxID=1897632 RepID=UPI000D3455D6|nr:TonB-dependent siderophore receptor [Saccharospirillum sp. MSK14-1]PTY35960.1 ligand-gated channel protein [Saccharospirillum sp. MSK14-1]